MSFHAGRFIWLDAEITGMSEELPPCPEGSVTQWIKKLQDGDMEAVERLWDLYFMRLVGLARRKLRNIATREADEEDVALIALNSFFDGARKGRFPLLSNRDGLWPLLARITEHKVQKLRSRHNAKKRGGGSPGDEVDWEHVPGPTNDAFIGELTLQCEELLAKLNDETLRRIAVMLLNGYTNAEIADDLDMHERTVERKRKIIRLRWETEMV